MPIDVEAWLRGRDIDKKSASMGVVESDPVPVINVGWCANCGEEHPKGHPCWEPWSRDEDDDGDPEAEAAQLLEMESMKAERLAVEALADEKSSRVRAQGKIRAANYRKKNRKTYNEYMKDYMAKNRPKDKK